VGAGLRGGVIRQGDEQFDDARAIYNGMIDKRPAVITRCVGGDRACPAQEIGSSLETQEWSESPPSTGMFTPVR
jgi:hypothetical protein